MVARASACSVGFSRRSCSETLACSSTERYSIADNTNNAIKAPAIHQPFWLLATGSWLLSSYSPLNAVIGSTIDALRAGK